MSPTRRHIAESAAPHSEKTRMSLSWRPMSDTGLMSGKTRRMDSVTCTIVPELAVRTITVVQCVKCRRVGGAIDSPCSREDVSPPLLSGGAVTSRRGTLGPARRNPEKSPGRELVSSPGAHTTVPCTGMSTASSMSTGKGMLSASASVDSSGTCTKMTAPSWLVTSSRLLTSRRIARISGSCAWYGCGSVAPRTPRPRSSPRAPDTAAVILAEMRPPKWCAKTRHSSLSILQLRVERSAAR
mmetsp:Transcript_20026/g.62194  ORF Transcript_20026/g.62194 Transcript_20026/m.62194 type:complete len:241 (+) Transcript_20026:3032-3754(+)